MMEFRRRWCAAVVVALMGVVGVARAADPAPAAPVDLAAASRELAGAHGQEAVVVQKKVVAGAPAKTVTVARNDYSKDVVKYFGPLVKDDKNPDAQLNAAIAISSMETLYTDGALEEMMASSNAGIRYWGARGLGTIKASVLTVQGATLKSAVDALNKALTVEKSGVVKQQIIRTLGEYGQADAVTAGVQALADQMQKGVPDKETLDAVAVGLNYLGALARDGKVTKKEDAGKAAAWAISFAAQHEVALKAARSKEGNDLPAGYHTRVLAVVKNGVDALNGLVGGKKYAFTAAADQIPEEVLLLVNGIAGSKGSGAGKLQGDLAGVAVPPEVAKSK